MDLGRRLFAMIALPVCLLGLFMPTGEWSEAHAADAQEEQGAWEVGILTGLYRPSLRTLNRVLQDPQLAIIQDPNQQLQPNIDFPPEVRNLLVPPFDKAFFTLGLEWERRYSPRHAFRLTLNLSHSSIEVSDIVPFIAGANVNQPDLIPRSSRYDIQISQLWLGWRYTLWQRSQEQAFYLDIGLIGLAFAKLTIDTLLKETNPAVVPTPFAVASSLEANGYGVTSRLGLGGNYRFTKWFGCSIRTDYVIGRVPRLRVDQFFRAGFAVPAPPEAVLLLPPEPNVGDTVTYAKVERVGGNPNTESATGTAALPLELTGLEIIAGLHFYF